MKLSWIHLMPYTDLPDDFKERHPSVWVDIDSRLFEPAKAHRMYNDFMDELEFAAERLTAPKDLSPEAVVEWQIVQTRASKAAARLLWPIGGLRLSRRPYRINCPTEIRTIPGAGHAVDCDAAHASSRSIQDRLEIPASP